MFDNPKKELQRLQRELLAAEDPEWEPEAEEDEDPDAALDEMKHLLQEDAWDESYREPLYQRYVPQEEGWDEEEDGYLDTEDEDEDPASRKNRSSIRGLVVAMILETLALVAVLLWWLLW